MNPGDTYILVDNPESRTVEGHEGQAVTILSRPNHGFVQIQIEGMGPVGRRTVLTRDLIRGGQLEMQL